jgi:hypothetical protein
VRSLYLAWKWTGGRMCPYRTHHVLDEDYRPLGVPGAAPRPPFDPRRVRNIVLGFARVAEDEQLALAGARLGG